MPNHARGRTLDEYLALYNSPIEVAHAAQHCGLVEDMSEPYPTPDEVRVFFAALTQEQQTKALDDLWDCPW